MGNRFAHLQAALDEVYAQLGNIIKISSVYESPAVGFEGADFLNCVVSMRTRYSASESLKILLSIEKKLGRTTKKGNAYESRVLDIDLLYYGESIIVIDGLQVPHPRMTERNFVLHPLAEIAPDLVHPILKKNTTQLLLDTPDPTTIQKQSKWLRNPKADYDISSLNYIAIEGNIGAGKTSLAQKIADDFNAKLILERFKDNPFLPKFYEDQNRYAFPLEMSFLADRYQQLLDDITQFDLFKDCVVADYDAYKSLIFAKVTLAEEEYNLYRKLFHLMHKELPKPDVYVYLYQNTERLLENIRKRGRNYEKGIEASYLQKINDGYLEFIKGQRNEAIKIIDISELDFVKERADYLYLLKEILR
jgi:deoxyguanosine kinase